MHTFKILCLGFTYFLIVLVISDKSFIMTIDIFMGVITAGLVLMTLRNSSEALYEAKPNDIMIYHVDRFASNWWLYTIFLGYFALRFCAEKINYVITNPIV